jgi:hypothetical protein
MMIRKLVTTKALAMPFAFLSAFITFNAVAEPEIPTLADEFLQKMRTIAITTDLEVCQVKSENAGSLMISRQNGDQMSDKISIFLENQSAIAAKMIGVTRLAWEEPVWQTTKNKQRAVDEFKNQIYTECFDEVIAKYK